MTAEQVFDEVRRVESLYYHVVMTSDACQVYDRANSDPLYAMIVDADFSADMLENAVRALDGLYDELVTKHTTNGDIEERRKRYFISAGLDENGNPRQRPAGRRSSGRPGNSRR